MTSGSTRPGVAPSASRTAISAVRRLTAYDTSPPMPIAESTSASSAKAASSSALARRPSMASAINAVIGWMRAGIRSGSAAVIARATARD